MEHQLSRHLFKLAGRLDRKTRARMAPDEMREGRKYDRAFATVEAAVKDDPRATRALFELEEAGTALAVCEAEIGHKLTLIVVSQHIDKIPPRRVHHSR